MDITVAEVPNEPQLHFHSPFLDVVVSLEKPEITALSLDSLGKRAFSPIPLRANPASRPASACRDVNRVEYRRADCTESSPPRWAFEIGPRSLVLRSEWNADDPPEDLLIDIPPKVCHATLLGRLRPGDDGCHVQLPAVLHLPDRGSLQIHASADNVLLGYDARRANGGYIRVTFPAATHENPHLEYRLDVAAIHLALPGIENDPRWDGFRRSWLNIFQVNPRLGVLANHAASDSCPFCYYEYADMAVKTPPLADGLTALDLVRESLDQYLGGMAGYGMPGYLFYDLSFEHEDADRRNNIAPSRKTEGYSYLDVYPSLLISAADYVNGSGDLAWFAKNYDGLKAWADEMLGMDKDGNGLIEYPLSGNSGSWPETLKDRPSNWWDTIGFGHEDAYANALAYRALQLFAPLCDKAARPDDAVLYRAAAARMRDAYHKAFFNPATGVLAGWRSADGQQHDYYFLWINGIAIAYDLVDEEEGRKIAVRLLAKMKEAGYSRFDLGLPGNLVPIARKDYVHRDHRWGGGQREDGSDAFQIYQNGGASACFAYYFLSALYRVGLQEEADCIFFAMLTAFDEGSFIGHAPNGNTYDWKAWDGTAWGYEGMLVDNYYALLAAFARAG